MPEGVEIEFYRRTAEAALGRQIEAVDASDEWFLKEETTREALEESLVGQSFGLARRVGKLLILDVIDGDASSRSDGPLSDIEAVDRLGLRFGMTGRLIVDESASIEYLEYSSKKDDPAWDRFILHFADGGDLRIRDPRRLGGVILSPDESRLGADLFALTSEDLRSRVLVGTVALKSRLMDQGRVAGIGNLIADETLWRAGLDPAQAAGAVNESDAAVLLAELAGVLKDFLRDGGSHTGQLQDSRIRGGHCPKDGAELDRRKIGGRTTYSCPVHQQISS